MPPGTVVRRAAFALLATVILQGCTPQTPKPAASASPATAPASVATTETATRPAAVVAEVTRRDVAEALMRFEAALYSRERTPEEWPAINKRFDAATTAFFAGGLGRVVKALDEMAWELDPATAPKTPEERAARAFKVRVEPGALVAEDSGGPLWPRTDGGNSSRRPDPPRPCPALFVVYPMYPLPAGMAPSRFTVVLRNNNNKAADPLGIDVEYPADRQRPLGVPFPDGFEPRSGVYQARIQVGTASFPAPQDIWFVRHPRDARDVDELKNRVSNVPTQPPAMRNALATFKARVAVLEDWPNEDRSAVFRADPVRIRGGLWSDADRLVKHEDPYRRRTGDLWRVAAGGGYTIPLRVYAPKVAADDAPRPLLVVLHGMGGDENMFLDAYGRGRIKALADRHGFVVASPNAYQISSKPELFSEVVEAMTLDYAIDPKRVYVLGHSMGAMAAGRVAAKPGAVAAAVLVAGPAPDKVPADAAPMLLISGDADRIVPASRVRQSAERLKSAGRSAEYREKAGWGHTLVVPEVLPEAVEWLMTKP